MSDEEEKDEGLPAWVMTFADLMTLLMCFYVLMLSFSEMDVIKFKQLSGSMKDAFGVQTDIKVKNIPKGTSVIAREFSPGKPQPTALNEVRQFTINSNQNSLDVGDLERAQKLREEEELAAKAAEQLQEALRAEIEQGKVLVRTEGRQVVVHILEKDSFPSGSAALEASFAPTLGKISSVLSETPSAISVSGHTDDVPIRNSRFRSNWDLSASRAASVAMQLLQNPSIEPERVMISGHADTQPRVPNDSPTNRAKNRRIDIRVFVGVNRHQGWVNETDSESNSEPSAVQPPSQIGPEPLPNPS